MAKQVSSEFVAAVNKRLEKGASVYGDRSFEGRKPAELLKEIREELLDVVAYGALAVERIDAEIKALTPAPARISRPLQVGNPLGNQSYIALVYVLQHNPGCVVYVDQDRTVILSQPDPGGYSIGLDNSKQLETVKVKHGLSASRLRDAALAAAFARGEVYHLPENP